MATWYRVSRWRDEPEPIEVVGETEKTIEIRHEGGYVRREHKVSDGYSAHRTKEDAEQAIWLRLQQEVERAERNLASAKSAFEKFRTKVGKSGSEGGKSCEQ